jgi:hypothetical protein
MSGFQVRIAAAADLDAIVEGFARACGKPPSAVAAKVRWALLENPAGSSGVVASDARGRVVAHLGATHVPMVIEGADVLFGRVYASWVDPAFRTAGVHSAFAEIDDAFRESFEGKTLAATFGVFADGDWWTLRRLRDFSPVRTELRLVRAPASPSREAPRVALASRGSVLAGFGGRIDGGPCAARRDSGVLRFRLGGPHSADHGWAALRDGLPSGIAVVRDGAAERTVHDFTDTDGDGDAAAALLDEVIGDGSRRGTLDWFSRSPWLLLSQRKGFRVAPGDLPYVAVRTARAAHEAHWLMEHWRLAAADVGLHVLPPMLASEEIVTSPPVGTLTGRERHA